MGSVVDKIKEIGSGDKKALDEMSTKIQETVGKLIVSIPIDYTNERQRIIDQMQLADPKPYEGLLYSDYPEKNGLEVNKRARNTVTSNEVKSQLADQVKEELKPTFDANTKDMNAVAKAAFQTAYDKAVEKAVDTAVDKVCEQLKQQENETVSKKAVEDVSSATSE